MRKLKWIVVSLGFMIACDSPPAPEPWRRMEVSASAYNSLAWQTQDDASITAFGDTLQPGMKAIAVSRDLLDSGLTHNTPVYIEEFRDTFLVKDKMHRRWTKKIDIYMDKNLDSAREWGTRKLYISWPVQTSE